MAMDSNATELSIDFPNRPVKKSEKGVKSFERNFITQAGAFKEYLLLPSQLEGLNKFFRRSPYESEVSIFVYNKRDVEKRAVDIWGSLENLEKEKLNPDLYKKILEQYNSEVKKNFKLARREGGDLHPKRHNVPKIKKSEPIAIAIALIVDILNLIFKLIVYVYTNSDSLLAETIHSLADTINQGILAVGLCQIAQAPNHRHPYGYSNTMYVASLISGVGIFCLGSAVAIFFGIDSLVGEHTVLFFDMMWAFIVLGFSMMTDAICFTFTVVASFRTSRKKKTSCCVYVFQGREPGLTVILMEDFVAVLGNGVAAFMLAISWYTDNMIPDAIGSIIIGILLGGVALFLIVSNSAALVGRSIDEEHLERINKTLESDVMIRAIYDVKGIDMGNNLVRYKAEIDFDGAELTRLYLENLNMADLLQKVRKIENVKQLESFMISHGEKIVDLLGNEIDRIEIKVRTLFPEVRHMDLEIL